jgi:hypothetical protein
MNPLRTLPDETREFLEKIEANQNAIRRSQKWQNAVTGVVIVVLAAGVAFFLVSASKTHDALCNLRGDLQTRVDTTHRFLRLHPAGIPGVPPALLAQQADGQQRTVNALAPLGCE